MKLQVDTSDIVKFENWLDKFNRTGIKYAARNTLNDLAFNTSAKAKEFVKDDFINKNTFTVRSIQVNKAVFVSIDSMFSEVGSTQEYMTKQEEGGKVKPRKGAKSLALATSFAANQTGNRRTRLVTRSNLLSKIVLRDKNKFRGITNQKQRSVATIINAKRNKYKHFYLDLGKSEGIFKLKNNKLRMVYNFAIKDATVNATNWLSKPTKAVEKQALEFYNVHLKKQIDRIIF